MSAFRCSFVDFVVSVIEVRFNGESRCCRVPFSHASFKRQMLRVHNEVKNNKLRNSSLIIAAQLEYEVPSTLPNRLVVYSIAIGWKQDQTGKA